MIYSILVFVFVLGVMIFVHELGHFIAAKLVDIQVLSFSIGFGKPLISFKWGETQYCLALIPFGGYVKMAGDDPAEMLEGRAEEKEFTTDPARHFDSKSMLSRLLVIVAGPLMNFLLAMFIFMGILHFQGAEVIETTTVDLVRQDLALPGTEKIMQGSRIVLVNDQQVSNWDEVLGKVKDSSLPSTTLILRDTRENLYQVMISTPDDSLRRKLAASLVYLIEPRLGSMTPDMPAIKAGMKPGDLILAIDGVPIRKWDEMTKIVHNSAGRLLKIQLERDGQVMNIEVTPQWGQLPGPDGRVENVGMIGIGPVTVPVYLSLPEAVATGAERTLFLTGYLAKSFGRLFLDLVTWKMSLRQARNVLGGPIMIGQMAGDSARSGNLAGFMAILSLNLFLLNLLPIPVLDGGHLLFLFIELVRFGKPLSPQQRLRFIQVGLVIVIALMIWALSNDLSRIFGL